MKWKLLAGAAFGVAFGAGAAEAGIDEVHLGVLAHNIQVIDGKNADKEDGPAIDAQLTFDSPGFLTWAGGPRPYAVVSANVSGDTSHAGVGLEWRWRFAEGWQVNPGFGYVVHDGELENPYAPGDPRSAPFSQEHVLLGSRDLFRSSLGVTRALGDNLSAQLFYVHLSHGQILGSGHNQGMDQLGVRLGYSWGQ